MATASKQRERIVDVFSYYRPDGNLAYEVVRFEPKNFKVRHKEKNGRYCWKKPPASYPYQLPELLAAKARPFVVIVEGERKVDLLRKHGFVATCNHGGAGNGKIYRTWLQYFKGLNVVICPDNDKPGFGLAELVKGLLSTTAARVVTLELPGLPPKGDVVDWFANESNSPELFNRLALAAIGAAQDTSSAVVSAVPEEYPPGDAFEPAADQVAEPADDDDDWQPFPLHALHVVLGAYVAAGAKSLCVDPSLIAVPALICCAGAVGNSRIVLIKEDWLEPFILWGAGVAPPSSRKTAAYKLGTAPLSAIDVEWADVAADAVEAYREELRLWDEGNGTRRKKLPDAEPARRPRPPVVSKIVVGDITIETIVREHIRSPRGLVLLRDELSGWFGSFGRYSASGASSAEVACWTECYEGGAYRYDRSTGDGTSLVVKRCCVSIYGATQPTILPKCLTPGLFDCGMAYRFMLFEPPEVPGDLTTAVIPKHVKSDFDWLVRSLVDLDAQAVKDRDWKPHPITFDAGGWDAFHAWHQKMERQIQRSQGDRKSLLAKGKAWCARIAGVLHLIDTAFDGQLSKTITAAQVERASTIADWAVAQTERCYARLKSEPDDRDRLHLLEWLRRQKRAYTARELRDTNKAAYPRTVRAQAALDALASAKLGHWQPRLTGTRGGRPTMEFSLF